MGIWTYRSIRHVVVGLRRNWLKTAVGNLLQPRKQEVPRIYQQAETEQSNLSTCRYAGFIFLLRYWWT